MSLDWTHETKELWCPGTTSRSTRSGSMRDPLVLAFQEELEQHGVPIPRRVARRLARIARAQRDIPNPQECPRDCPLGVGQAWKARAERAERRLERLRVETGKELW